MVFLLTLIAAATLVGLTGLHLYWAGGGQWGVRYVVPEVDGKPLFRPQAVTTLVVAVLLFWGAAILIDVASSGFLIRRYPVVVLLTLWVYGLAFSVRALAGWFLVAVLGKGRKTVFGYYELRIYGPVCLLLGVVFLLLALVLTP
jgi:hypothetical protein